MKYVVVLTEAEEQILQQLSINHFVPDMCMRAAEACGRQTVSDGRSLTVPNSTRSRSFGGN
ncbi:MAG: hypothetical protein PPHEESC_5542 [uncultured Paraburkholderia sp.]|nr:MAG: hypothetical protein PPHEESC_5542 [uncultured Paraburkholderia sp.]CAH2940624.1 MAG: hypothetical protein PPHEMADMSA_5465 [uncultured Paraburkholderia sp.]